MIKKIANILEEETGGKSYKAHKYSLDNYGAPSIDFGGEREGNVWKKTMETTRHSSPVDLSNLIKKLASSDEQLLTYFLDGSRRVYKVDHQGYPASGTGNRSEIFPIIAGQIGIGCCKRINKELKTEKFLREIVISLPDKADADGKGGFFPALAQKITAYSTELNRLKISIDGVLSYSTATVDNDRQYEDRATATIQDRMIKQEKETVAALVREGKLDQNNYLIKDGSLEYKPTNEDRKDKRKLEVFKNNYAWVLGASKHFNPSVCLDSSGKPNPGFIASLPLYHRTPVACFSNPSFFGDIQFAVWYIRLREQSKTRTPFDGILKVEKMLITTDEKEYGMESELVDTLSALIINERNPVCYGSDMRWANHIYPMYLTENLVKSRYISTESFLQLF